jgi:hypothetical protein
VLVFSKLLEPLIVREGLKSAFEILISSSEAFMFSLSAFN